MQHLTLLLQAILFSQILITLIVVYLVNTHGTRWRLLCNLLCFSLILTLLVSIILVYNFAVYESMIIQRLTKIEDKLNALGELMIHLSTQPAGKNSSNSVGYNIMSHFKNVLKSYSSSLTLTFYSYFFHTIYNGLSLSSFISGYPTYVQNIAGFILLTGFAVVLQQFSTLR